MHLEQKYIYTAAKIVNCLLLYIRKSSKVTFTKLTPQNQFTLLKIKEPSVRKMQAIFKT